MKCPRCQVALSISDRQGVEIDFCPQCRGVWLDRGELDKVIERASRFGGDDDDRDRWRGPERRPDYDRDSYYKKRKSFWGRTVRLACRTWYHPPRPTDHWLEDHLT